MGDNLIASVILLTFLVIQVVGTVTAVLQRRLDSWKPRQCFCVFEQQTVALTVKDTKHLLWVLLGVKQFEIRNQNLRV